MRRERLTREDAREQTRRRLLDAAASSIARKGLAATTVEDIAAQAGYTRGAFYSNFSSKYDLFVELLQLDHQNIQNNLRELLDAVPSSEDMKTRLVRLCTQCYRDDEHYVMWAEARLHAMRDAKFRRHINAMYMERHEMIAAIIERFRKRVDVMLPRSFVDPAFAAIALMDGVHYFTMTLPNVVIRAIENQ